MMEDTEEIQKRRIKRVYRVMLVAGSLIVVGYFLIARYGLGLVSWADWTGFGETTLPNNEYRPTKTLWDWLDLLIIPVVLAVGAWMLNKSERKSEREEAEKRAATDREIALDRQRQATLQAYYDRMTELLLEERLLKSSKDDPVRAVARTITLATLRGLDGGRKGQVIQFLYEADLINKHSVVVSLREADLYWANLYWTNLREADLRGASLKGADLEEADLRGVDLRGAFLEEAYLGGANLREADLREAFLTKADLSWANLRKADLEEADLKEADLNRVYLNEADLNWACLERADLSEADLRMANLMEANLREAILSEANISEANLCGANLRGADLERADLSRADLGGSDLRGANLRGANLTGANLNVDELMLNYFTETRYDTNTEWPEGFDPIAAGAVLVEDDEQQ